MGRVDLGEYGVRVNSVSPDVVPTGIFGKGAGRDAAAADGTAEKVAGALTPLLAKSQPIAEAVTVEDVAAAVLWFAQDGSRLVTGQDLGIDGGSSAGRPMHVGRAERAVFRDALA